MPGTVQALIIAGVVLAAALPAAAQPAPKPLGTFEAWTAAEYAERGAKACYMLARPEKSETKPPGAKRGAILLIVTHRPAEKRRDEVTFESGYPLKDGSTVTVEIDRKKFELFTRTDIALESAWATDAAADKALVEAMRAGNTMVVKGVSSRGTETIDTFSLSGFAKAHGEIGKTCPAK
ncbi:MAG: hypothetical protein HY057_05880 [Rhodospirillales bacterium]|nr:hypothetical protein [Rhodospirillales bacterium]